jgi:hypothetical protein
MATISRRNALLISTGVWVSGCGSALGGLMGMDDGDHVAYSLWNASNLEVQKTSLTSIDGQGLNSSLVRKGIGQSKGWQGDGLRKFPDAGHRIPERVKLSWRELPKAGQKVYQGDLVGPFDLALRSRIPADVLSQVRASRKFRLEMAFSVGVQPIQFRWRLVQADLDNSSPLVEVRRGGDW